MNPKTLWTNPELMMASSIILLVCYALILIFSIYRLVLQMGMKTRSFQRPFHVILSVACAMRVLTNAWFLSQQASSPVSDVLLGFLPSILGSFLFFSAYQIVLLFFIDMYHTSTNGAQYSYPIVQRIKKMLLALNIVMYLSVLTATSVTLRWALLKEKTFDADYQKLEVRDFEYFIGALYLAWATAMLGYGTSLYRKLYSINELVPTARSRAASVVLFKIGLLTSVVTIAFSIRIVLDLLESSLQWVQYWPAYLGYFLLLEILPLSTTMFLYSQKRAAPPKGNTIAPVITAHQRLLPINRPPSAGYGSPTADRDSH